jgi:hypothetical protein
LTFTVVKTWGYLGFQQLRAVIENLKSTAVTKRLKELIISLQVLDHGKPSATAVEIVTSFEGWNDLDQAISTLPTLQKVVINLDFLTYTAVTRQHVRPSMRQCLPLLDSRGILSIESSNIADLETLVWPRGDWHWQATREQ